MSNPPRSLPPATRLLVVVLFLFCAPALAAAQTSAPAQNAVPGIQDAGQQVIVEEVEFRGNRRIPTDTVRLYVTTKPGDIYNEDQVQRDFQAVLAQGFFDEFGCRVFKEEGVRGGVIIVFQLRERPIIRDIQYEGLKSVQLSDVLTRFREKRISLTKDSPFDPVQVKRAEEEVKTMLSERGRPEANVKAEREDVSATTVIIVFNVDEGPRVSVANIDFEGNTVFSSRQLRRAMKLTKPSSFLTRFNSKDVYDPGKFANDLLLVKQFLFEKGYIRPVIGEPKVEDLGVVSRGVLPFFPFWRKQVRSLKITVPIEEGVLYRFGDITVEGATIYTPDQVKLITGLKKGDIASGKTIREGVYERLKKAYGSQGYIQAEVNLNQDLIPPKAGEKEGIANFTLNIEEGSVYTIRQIEFLGNSVTRDQVMRREIFVNEGDVYNEELFDYSRQRLNQLGFFEEVKKEDVQIQTDDREKKVDINIRVKERGRQQIQFTGGVSGIGGSFIGITYSTNNLFGYGQTLAVDVQAGNRQRLISVSYTEPYFLGRNISLGVSVFSSRYNFVNGIALSGQLFDPTFTGTSGFFGQSGATLFTQTSNGVTLNFSAPLAAVTTRFPKLARFTRVGLSYSFSQSKVTDPAVNRDADPNNDILVTFRQPGITASTISPSLVYNSLNSFLDPTEGRNVTLALSFSGLGGDVKTIQPTFEYREFRPMRFLSRGNDRAGQAVLGYRFLAQHVSPFGTTFDSNSLAFVGGVPIFSRFFLGGENTIRGYNIRSISPVAEVQTFQTTTNVQAVDIATGRVLQVLRPGQRVRGIAQSVLDQFTYTNRQVTRLFPEFTQVGGDTQLLVNLEYRIPLAGPLSMALFGDAGSVFNLRSIKNQSIASNPIPTTFQDGFLTLNPRGLIATQREIDRARTPETAPGALPPGFRSVSITGNLASRQDVLLADNLGGIARNFRASIGAEVRVQVPVLQVPFRLIFAYNPNARVFDLVRNPDPRLLAFEQKFTVRFTVGRTF